MITYIKYLVIVFFIILSAHSQTLTVSLGNNNHATAYESPDGKDIIMMQVKLTADTDMEVLDLTIDPSGNVKRGELVGTEIQIYEDINQNGVLESGIDEFIAEENYSENSNQTVADPVVINIPGKSILNGVSQYWLIVHTFSGAADRHNIKIDITDVSVSSGNVTGLPVEGNTHIIETNPSSKDGALYIGLAGNNPLTRDISSSASNETMLQLICATSTLKDASISSIEFDMSGTGNEGTDLLRARLFVDGDANGILNLEQDTLLADPVSSMNDNGVLSFTGLNKVIKAGAFEHWIVVYDFNGNAADNETFKLDLVANSDISVPGMAISGAPLSGNTVTVSGKGSLTISEGAFNPDEQTISASQSNLSMIQIDLSANTTEDINISSISFKTSGTANEATDIDSAILVLDANNNGVYDIVYDTKIGNGVTSFTDNGIITFSELASTITKGNSQNWLLVYYLNGNAASGSTLRTYFDETSQITASGSVSSESIFVMGLPVNGNLKTTSTTGTLTLSLAETNQGDANFSNTATNLSMLSFRMTANDVEDINITAITLTAQTNNMVKNDIEDNDIKIYQDIDENGLLDESVDRFIIADNYGGHGQVLGEATFSFDNETIPAGNYVQWLIVHTINGSSVGDYIEVSVLKTNVNAQGVTSSGAANIAGINLFGGTKTHVSGIAGQLTLSAAPQNPAYRYLSPGEQDETLLQFQLVADAVENIEISTIKIINSGTGFDNSDIDSVRLFLDADNDGILNSIYDTQLGNTVLSPGNNDTLIFSGFSEIVYSTTAKSFIVIHNFSGANNTTGETYRVITGNELITATGMVSGTSITPQGGPVYGEWVTITNTGTLSVAAGYYNPANSNITNADNNIVVIQLKLSAGSNEDINISSITFNLSGLFDDSADFETDSFRLFADDNGNGSRETGEVQLGTGQTCTSDNGFITFSGFNDIILAGANKNYIVLTNLNGNASNSENFRVSFENSTDISAIGVNSKKSIYPDGAPVQGGLFTVATTGSLTLAKGSNNSVARTESASAQAVEMLQLKLSASFVEDIEITSITLAAAGSGDDQADLNDTGHGVSLFHDTNNDGLLDGGDSQIDIERSYSANNGIVTFYFSEIITAGTIQNWLVVYDMDGSATVGETFNTGIYNASQITSVGVVSGNPITESGFPVAGDYITISDIGSLSLFTGDYNPQTANISTLNEYEMLQFKLSASSIESIIVGHIIITHIGSGNPENDLINNGVCLVNDVNNNGIYESAVDDILATTNFNGNTAYFTLNPDTILFNATQNWLVMYSFNNNIPAGVSYRAIIDNLTDIQLRGENSGQTIIAGGNVPITGGTMYLEGDETLPVKLNTFVAKGDAGVINLFWKTESEINNLGFTVERKSETEEDYVIIASYLTNDALIGAGNVSYQNEYVFIDSTVIPGVLYSYRLLQHDYDGTINVEEIITQAKAEEIVPASFLLEQNYPNPFNPYTFIKFQLAERSRISLVVFNILGQEIKTLVNETLDAGKYHYVWDGTNDLGVQAASGYYFSVLKINTSRGRKIIKNRKMVKLK